MALPTTVPRVSIDAAVRSKPFLSSAGNVYIITRIGSDTDAIGVVKATDPTDSFSDLEVDFDLVTGSIIRGLDAIQVGDKIHVAAVVASTAINTVLTYSVFDMETDSWEISGESVVGPYECLAVNDCGNCGIGVRSDGDVIIVYNSEVVANMGSDRQRVSYARREGGSWTVDVSIDEAGAVQWICQGLVVGASDRMHFFLTDTLTSDAYQRTLTSANALETFPSAYNSDVFGDIQNFHTGTSYVSGGTMVRMPITPSTVGDVDSTKCDSADAPTMSQDSDISGSTVISNSIKLASSFTADGTTLWHTFRSVGDIYVQFNEDDGGWSEPELFEETSGSGIRTNLYTRDGAIVIGMSYGNTYHEYVIDEGSTTTDADFDMDAAAALTWNATSTATAALDSDAAASLTWNGQSTAASDLTSTALASITWGSAGLWAVAFDMDTTATLSWEGDEIVSTIEAAAFEVDAVAALTWVGEGIHSASWSAASTASLTWNGTATAAGYIDTDIDAFATLRMEGAGEAASALSTTALANLTWDGASLAHAMFLVWPANATLNWNGAAIAVSEASFDMDAAADLTWNGTSVVAASWSAAAGIVAGAAAGAAIASADLQVTTLASLTWNGITTAGAAFDADALADLTWNSVEIFSAAFDSDAAASLTWTGASIATINSAFSMAAASSVTWNGAVVMAGAWHSSASSFGFGDPPIWESGPAEAALQAAAQATQSWSGAQDAGAAWSATAAATVTMAGVEVAAASWTIAAAATIDWEGQEVGEASSFGIDAAASVTFGGEDATPAAAFDPITRDGWRVNAELARELEEADEEDIILMLTAAVAYMEQADAY
jgi:hypothetical protein